MSILPLQFHSGDSAKSLNLTGRETYSIEYNVHDDEKLATVRVSEDENGERKEETIHLLSV